REIPRDGAPCPRGPRYCKPVAEEYSRSFEQLPRDRIGKGNGCPIRINTGAAAALKGCAKDLSVCCRPEKAGAAANEVPRSVGPEAETERREGNAGDLSIHGGAFVVW